MQEKMEREMFLEYMNEKGQDSQQRLLESLEQFAKLDEFDDLQKQFTQIMINAKENQKKEKQHRGELVEKIDKEVDKVMKKYNRRPSE